MRDVTKGPTTPQPQPTETQGTSSVLSALTVSPATFMEGDSRGNLPIHDQRTVETKWATRTFDTGVVIEGVVKRGGR